MKLLTNSLTVQGVLCVQNGFERKSERCLEWKHLGSNSVKERQKFGMLCVPKSESEQLSREVEV